MLLDEATSSLDKATEADIMSGVWESVGKQTKLIVAQRLSSIRDADRIFCMSEGQIVEVGSHDELMEKQGIYYNLVVRQEESENIDTLDTTETEEIKL